MNDYDISKHYKEYFISKWPEEGVGYIKSGKFYPLENKAVDKIHSFAVDESFMLDEPEILLHSHTVGHEPTKNSDNPKEPSYLDLLGQINTDIEWGICVTDGEVCEDPVYWGNPDNRPELIGRDFIYNIQDCFALAQDWYYKEIGLTLPNYPRDKYWNRNGENYIMEQYSKYGFIDVALEELKPGDALLYQVQSKVPCHIGIYLGNGQVISHWFGRQSAIESYGKFARYIVRALRYANTK